MQFYYWSVTEPGSGFQTLLPWSGVCVVSIYSFVPAEVRRESDLPWLPCRSLTYYCESEEGSLSESKTIVKHGFPLHYIKLEKLQTEKARKMKLLSLQLLRPLDILTPDLPRASLSIAAPPLHPVLCILVAVGGGNFIPNAPPSSCCHLAREPSATKQTVKRHARVVPGCHSCTLVTFFIWKMQLLLNVLYLC